MNLNDNVMVKLTPFGLEILEQRHNELNETIKNRGGKGLPCFEKPRVNEQGFTKFQLWVLMSTFGKYCNIGCDLPFESNILTNVNLSD